MSSWKRAKTMEQRQKDLISGYVRESTKSISYTTIPIMINYICLLYYYITDKFIKCTTRIEISSTNNKEASKASINEDIKSSWRNIWENIHGNIIINPRDNPNLIATWIIKMNFRNECIIGIHGKYNDDASFATHGQSPHYGWWGPSGIMISHDVLSRGLDRFKSGDTVKMVLDVAKKQLKFYKNEQETNVACDNINLCGKYHLMIRVMHYRGGSCQIIRFNVKHYDSLSFHSDS